MTDPLTWLTETRKLDVELLAAMGVKPVDHPVLGSAVAFPYRRDGESYAAKFRTVGKEFRSTAGRTRDLYNRDILRADHALPVVITEGEIDCLSVIQAGFVRAVSLPDGWTSQGNKLDALVEAEGDLRNSPYVIVAADSDKAGESLPRAVAKLLRGHDVRYARWPQGCKDPNDVLMSAGEGELASCLSAAARIDPPGGFITGLDDLPPLSERRVLRTGLDWLRYHLAFEVGALSVMTGIPGAGKTTFATFVAYHVARCERIKVGLFLFETHPHRVRDHICRLRNGKPFDALFADERASFDRELGQRFRLVHRTFEESAGHHIGWLEEMVETLAVRDGCKLIVIDPWNELEHLPDKGESMTSYINFALQHIRKMAERFEVHILLAAHPKKLNTEKEIRAPIGYDIADSAAFANKPSLGFTIHPKNSDGQQSIELRTWKVRDSQLYGFYKGTADLGFDPVKMEYFARSYRPQEVAA